MFLFLNTEVIQNSNNFQFQFQFKKKMSSSKYNILQEGNTMKNSIDQFEKSQFLCCFFQTGKDKQNNQRNSHTDWKERQKYNHLPFQDDKNSQKILVKTPSKLMFKRCNRQYEKNQENIECKTAERFDKSKCFSPNPDILKKVPCTPSLSATNSKGSKFSQNFQQVFGSDIQSPLLEGCQSNANLNICSASMKKKKSLTPLIKASMTKTKAKNKRKDLLCAKDLFQDERENENQSSNENKTRIFLSKENIKPNYQSENKFQMLQIDQRSLIQKGRTQTETQIQDQFYKAFKFPQITKLPAKQMYIMSFQDKNEENLQSKVIEKFVPINFNGFTEATFNKLPINKSTKRISKLPISTANSQDVLNSFCKNSFESVQNRSNSNENGESAVLDSCLQNKQNYLNMGQKYFLKSQTQNCSPLRKTVKKETMNTSSKIRAFRQDTRTVNSVWGSYINNDIKVDQSLIVMDFFKQNSQKQNQEKMKASKEFKYKYFSDYIEKKIG